MCDCAKIIIFFFLVFYIEIGNCVKILGLVVPPVVDLQDDTVSLDCKYDLEDSELYSVKWYKDENEFFRYVPRGGGTRSFEMPGVNVKTPESSKTVCNLRHCPVTLTHLSRLTEGSYRCEISTEAPKFRLYFDTANISIVALPRGTVSIATPKTEYSEGEDIWVNCTSPPADPPPKIRWYINDKLLDPGAIISQSDSSPDDRGLIIRSLAAHLPASKSLFLKHNNLLVLRCEVNAPTQLPLHATAYMTLAELKTQKFDWLSSSGTTISTARKLLYCTILTIIVSFYTRN